MGAAAALPLPLTLAPVEVVSKTAFAVVVCGIGGGLVVGESEVAGEVDGGAPVSASEKTISCSA